MKSFQTVAALLGPLTLAVSGVFLLQRRTAMTEIGVYATSLKGRMANQRHNAALSAASLNGAVIEPRGRFSFNQTVRTWTSDTGYKKAPVSFNGQLIDAWGGGVCQTSTTLYNAALLAGMEIVERNPHNFAPGYVPAGRDAAVAYSNIDLIFVNPYNEPVRIVTSVDNKRIRIALMKQGPTGRDVRVFQHEESRTSAATVKLVNPKARIARVRNSGKNGWETTTYRSIDGEVELVSRDSYPSMTRIVEYR